MKQKWLQDMCPLKKRYRKKTYFERREVYVQKIQKLDVSGFKTFFKGWKKEKKAESVREMLGRWKDGLSSNRIII